MPLVNSSRHYAQEFAARAASRGSDRSFKVLDAGAGSAPYASLFSHVHLEMADVCMTPGKDYSHIDLVCDILDIPVEDGRYDMVWCSQTLEHVREPMVAMREFNRVLKPGGEAWLTAPFFYQEHEIPWDFYRFSRYAWQHFAQDAGFEVVEIEPLEGFYGMLSYVFSMAAKQLPKDLPGELDARRGQLKVMAEEFSELDLVDKRTDIGMCKNYAVVLRKPVGDG